jgi:hypothetical protein
LSHHRFRGALLAALMLSIPFAQAQWWNRMDMTPPKYWGTPFAPKVVYTHETFRQASQAAHGYFWSDDFEKLDRMYDELARDGVRATDGSSMIAPFAEVFAQAGSSPVFDKAMADWAAKSPQSHLRPLAMAIRWQGDAWRARGGGSAGATPDEAMQIFQERLGRATKALEQAEPEGRKSPLWYWVALIVAGSSQQPETEFDALFDESVARFPYYQPLYYTRVNYLLPQWGGSYEAVDRFVQRAVARTRETEGESFYAWIYLDIARKVGGDLFATTLATWPKMKKAFEDLVARYPDPYNRNAFASVACYARDRETTASLLTVLGKDAQLGQWFEGVSTESCRRFALTGA